MLKKLSVIVASIFIVFTLFISNRVPVVDRAKEYEVYLKSCSTSNIIKKISNQDFKFVLGVKGESFSINKNEFHLAEFLSDINAEIVFSEHLSNVVCYYGYSPKVKYLEMIKGELINVHIAIGEDFVKVGFPLIYGSF